MELSALILLALQGCGVLFLAVGWLGRNEWVHPFLGRLRKCLAARAPWGSLHRVSERLRGQIQDVAGHLALLRLRVELLEEAGKVAMVTTDPEGLLEWASKPFCELVGLPLSELRGQNWKNAIHQEDRDAVMRAWRGAVLAQADFSYEFRYWNATRQRETWVRTEVFPAMNPLSHEVCGWVGVVKPLERAPGWAQCPAGHFMPPM